MQDSAPHPPPQDTLTEISEWLERHPREVVILACRNFEGLSEDLHEYLVACIKNIFGDMLCPRGVRRGRISPRLSRGRGIVSLRLLLLCPGCGCCHDSCSR